MGALSRCYNVHDLRLAAKRRLPKGIFEYIDFGTEEGVALRENRAAFDRIRLKTRFLVDLGDRDMGTEIFGKRLALPLGIAPTGINGLCWHDADAALARAARDAGIPFTLAHPAMTTMERIAEVGGNLWFQIYMWDEVEYCHAVIKRASDLGFEALVVTIDSALGRLREHNERNGFDFPFRPNVRAVGDMLRHPRWLASVLGRAVLTSGMPRNLMYPAKYQRVVAWRGDAPKPRRFERMTWADLERIREIWPGALVVKSILSPEEARLAVDHGADGIVVSNHGGRSMDSAVATIDALSGIAAEVGGQTTIIVDSGVRRGSDIVKALALGADMAMVGRVPLYGVSVAGEVGAARAIEFLATEFEKTMGYLGCRRVSEIDPDLIVGSSQDPR